MEEGERVAGDPLALREQLPDSVQDGVKLTGFPDQCVAVRQEYPAHLPVQACRAMRKSSSTSSRGRRAKRFSLYMLQKAQVLWLHP